MLTSLRHGAKRPLCLRMSWNLPNYCVRNKANLKYFTTANDEQQNCVVLDVSDCFATITLNRPNVHNAMSETVIAQLKERLDEVISLVRDKDKGGDIRALFLKSNGKNFSAGADLDYMKRLGGFPFEKNVEDAMKLSSMFNTLATLEIPTVAVVQGAAYGGALGLISACDIAIAETRSTFCFSEVKLGLIPATIGPFVIERIGANQCKRFFLTAEVFDAVKATSIGLVHEHSEDLPALEEKLKTSFRQNSPSGMNASKYLITEVATRINSDGINVPLRQFTAELLANQRGSSEAKEGLSSFLNKTRPAYNKS